MSAKVYWEVSCKVHGVAVHGQAMKKQLVSVPKGSPKRAGGCPMCAKVARKENRHDK